MDKNSDKKARLLLIITFIIFSVIACSPSAKSQSNPNLDNNLNSSTLEENITTSEKNITDNEHNQIKNYSILLFDFIKKYLVPLIAISLLFLIIYSAIKSSVYQSISAFFLTISLIFYYSKFIALFLIKIPIFGYPLGESIIKIHYYVINHLPIYDGLNFFGKKLLEIRPQDNYEITNWPLYFLIMGFIVRLIIDKYIKNLRLKSVSSEYWLFITTYIVIASIISYVINWNFFTIIFFSVAIVMLFAAGLLRVLSDIFTFLLETFRLFLQTIKIFTKWLALFLARVAKFIRNLVKKIRELYTRYIVEPIKKFYNRIKNHLDKLENIVNNTLEREKIDDE